MWLPCDTRSQVISNQGVAIFPEYFDPSVTHYSGVITGTMASQITSCLTIVYSTFYSGADQGKHQSSAPLAFVRGIHRWPVNSPHKGPVTRKMFPFDDVIMTLYHSDTRISLTWWHMTSTAVGIDSLEATVHSSPGKTHINSTIHSVR